jgi:hypothetical protein
MLEHRCEEAFRMLREHHMSRGVAHSRRCPYIPC